ncbi:hypothetical protein D8674_009858 [Pyrus ussuriensis x Pyrus communis]|uniref:Uncharacterized protein n=1 Tax=Pyrus ussuriensis x Pyrus communis TaxID=2448454 RepID=A0A5N5F9G5_9ROSA|nr:hypothetical protein D8674_009858 [Pyrus ussuriensis x Pyrus communis]
MGFNTFKDFKLKPDYQAQKVTLKLEKEVKTKQKSKKKRWVPFFSTPDFCWREKLKLRAAECGVSSGFQWLRRKIEGFDMGWYVREDPDETTPTYFGGKVTYIDNCDKDLMSLPMINDMVEAVGYISGPSKLVIEEISSSEGDVGPTPLKPIRYRGLLVGERNADSGNGQKEKNGEGPEENKGKSVAKVGEEDTEVEEGDTKVGERDVGEGDVEVFFDVPISFEGNIEEENEEAVEEDDSEFEESEYRSDADNPVFSKFDGIVEENAREFEHRIEGNSEQTYKRDSEQRSARQSEQSWEREKEQKEEEFDTATLEQNVVDDPDYNSDVLESVHSEDE